MGSPGEVFDLPKWCLAQRIGDLTRNLFRGGIFAQKPASSGAFTAQAALLDGVESVTTTGNRLAAGSTFETAVSTAILRYRVAILVVTLLVVGVVGSGMRFITLSTEVRDNFGPDNPQLLAFEAIEETFSRIDNAFFAIAPASGDVFTPEVLEVIGELTEEAWRTPGVKRVDSLTNYQHTEAQEDDLVVSDLVALPIEPGAARLAKIREIALNEPLIRNRLVSTDGRVAGVNVDFHFDPGDPDAELNAAHWAWEKKAAIMAAHPEIAVYATGTILISASFTETAFRDLQIQTPLMYAFIIVVLGLFLRSVVGVAGIVLTTLLTLICALGAAGWLGIQLAPMSSQSPIMILTVVVAHGVHLLVAYYQGIRAGGEQHGSMFDALVLNLQPIALTSLSTAIGFLSLNVLADVPPIQDIGNIVAMGVGFAFVFSLTFLPAVVTLLPNRVQPAASTGTEVMGRLADFVIRRRHLLFASSMLVSVILIGLAPLNVISDRFSKYFGEDVEVRVDTDFTDANLGGLYLIEYSLDTGVAQGVSDPAYLQTVEEFAQWYRQQPFVSHVNTYTDILKRLNKNLHGDEPEWYKVPDSSELAAQYLLLYELSLPFGLDMTNQINFDKSSSRFVVSLPSMRTPDLIELQARGTRWLEENAPELAQEGSGAALMFTYIGIRGMQGSVKGALIAGVLIAFVLILALRSIRMGIISLLPNLLPGAAGFGVWYLLSGEIGQSLSLVLGVTMGIVVDDTVHFLSKYLRARNRQGLSPEDAVRYAFRSVGVALWITTVVLIVGFCMLATSDFKPNGDTGVMVSIVIAIALVLDFLFLPPLLLYADRWRGKAGSAST